MWGGGMGAHLGLGFYVERAVSFLLACLAVVARSTSVGILAMGYARGMTTLVHDMPGCEGCPLREDGHKPFVADELVEGAPVLIYGQNPGVEEARDGKPFVGVTGQVMERNFFPLAGLARGEVSLGNTLRCRYKGSNFLPDLGNHMMQDAVEHCTKAHHRLPTGTKVIIATGEYAVYAMTGNIKPFNDEGSQPSGWRGFVLPYNPAPNPYTRPISVWSPTPKEIPVLITYHIARLFREPAQQVCMKKDWTKVPRMLTGTWPQKFPLIHTDPPPVWPKLSGFDTEFRRDNRKLVRYSLAAPGMKVWVVEAQDAGSVPVAPGSTVVMHNAPADLASLGAMVDLANVQVEDSMYLDAVMWSTFPHDLNTLGSLYGHTNRHKHLEYINPVQYAGGDALHTLDAWGALAAQMERDPRSKWVYEHCQRPLIPIIMRSKLHGSRVDRERAKLAVAAMHTQQENTRRWAQVAVGWPLNVGSSKHVADWLYKVEGLK